MDFGFVTPLQFLAVLFCGVFAGAALYINLVEYPARMEAGAALALRQWAPSYRRATVMQAPLALLGGLAAFAAWLGGASPFWLLGGLLLWSVVPFTLLVIMPTNGALLASNEDQDLPRIESLLRRWNRLHAVRTALSTASFVLFAWQMLTRASR